MAASGVDIGGGQVLQALVIALMVVVADERINLSFEITGQNVRSCLGSGDDKARRVYASYLCRSDSRPAR